jgi:hypothetical protein
MLRRSEGIDVPNSGRSRRKKFTCVKNVAYRTENFPELTGDADHAAGFQQHFTVIRGM